MESRSVFSQSVPEGRTRIAQRFNAGLAAPATQVPKGRLNCDSTLNDLRTLQLPALKRRAIFTMSLRDEAPNRGSSLSDPLPSIFFPHDSALNDFVFSWMLWNCRNQSGKSLRSLPHSKTLARTTTFPPVQEFTSLRSLRSLRLTPPRI